MNANKDLSYFINFVSLTIIAKQISFVKKSLN